MKRYILMMSLGICLIGCDNGGSNVSSTSDDTNDDSYANTCYDNGYKEEEVAVEDDQEDHIFTCQICQGSGVTLYFDGSIIPCYGCGGNGYISAKQLQSVLNQTNSSEGDDDDY